MANFDHVDGAIEAKESAGKGERGSPLARAGFGGEVLGAGFAVVVGLRDGGVRLVAADGTGALVFVVDVCRGIEQLLKAHGAQQRSGAPESVGVTDFFRDLDVALRRHLLRDEILRKDGGHVRGGDGLLCAGMQRRGHRLREVGQQVVPVCRNGGLRQSEASLHCGTDLTGRGFASRVREWFGRGQRVSGGSGGGGASRTLDDARFAARAGRRVLCALPWRVPRAACGFQLQSMQPSVMLCP